MKFPLRLTMFVLALLTVPISAGANPLDQCGYARMLGLNWWTGTWRGYEESGKYVADESNSVDSKCVFREAFSAHDGTRGYALIRIGPSGHLEQPYFSLNPRKAPTPGGQLTSGAPALFTFSRVGPGQISKITWERIAPNVGRQTLQISADGAKTWKTVFELFLVRVTGGHSAAR